MSVETETGLKFRAELKSGLHGKLKPTSISAAAQRAANSRRKKLKVSQEAVELAVKKKTGLFKFYTLKKRNDS